jgi:hypothetical protein
MDKSLQQFSNFIKYGIPINYFQDSVNQWEFPNTPTLLTIKETKKIMKVVVISATEVERVYCLMNSIATNKKNGIINSEYFSSHDEGMEKL